MGKSLEYIINKRRLIPLRESVWKPKVQVIYQTDIYFPYIQTAEIPFIEDLQTIYPAATA